MNTGGKVSRFGNPPLLAEKPRQAEEFCLIGRSHGIVTPRPPQLTPKPVIGIVTTDKLLGLGIPLQLATKAER
jgi:hypothetical protein